MEIFGIIILLSIRLLVAVSHEQAILIACLVAVACGYAGDAMNDYKTGHILNSDPQAQFVTQLLGGLAGVLVAVPTFFLIIAQYGSVGAETGLTAAQAHSVSAMVSGIGDPLIFTAALLAGLILFLLKIPSMIIGIGMILGLGISTSIFLGGAICSLVTGFKSDRLTTKGNIIAAGLLGGEGITSTVIALIAVPRLAAGSCLRYDLLYQSGAGVSSPERRENNMAQGEEIVISYRPNNGKEYNIVSQFDQQTYRRYPVKTELVSKETRIADFVERNPERLLLRPARV